MTDKENKGILNDIVKLIEYFGANHLTYFCTKGNSNQCNGNVVKVLFSHGVMSKRLKCSLFSSFNIAFCEL